MQLPEPMMTQITHVPKVSFMETQIRIDEVRMR